MKQRISHVNLALRSALVCIVVLSLLLISATPLLALDINNYFQWSYSAQFSKTQVNENESFTATITGTATCKADLPAAASEGSINGRVVAQHKSSGARVTLNSSYTVSIPDVPDKAGEGITITQTVPLQFPSGSALGEYAILGEIILARVKVIIWFDVTQYVPASQPLGTVTYGTPPPTSSGGGGGGGGGGGSSSTSAPLVATLSETSNDVSLTVDSAGTIQRTTQIKTVDSSVVVDIASGTKLTDDKGKALTTISAVKEPSPPSAPPRGAVISAYKFGPDGAQFNPAIKLTLAYDPATLPAGVAEGELTIAYWDGTQWQTLQGTVDTRTKTVSAMVTHFTTFAIMGKLPAPATTLPPTPTSTSIPAPTATVTPSATPTPLATPTPTMSSTPSATPVPTTPAPTPAPPASKPFNWMLVLGIVGTLVIIGIAAQLVIVLKKR